MVGLGRWPAVVAIVLVAAGLTGWSSTGFDPTPPPAPSRVRPRGPAGQPAARPGARASRPSHLIVVVEENHSLEQIIGSPAAPFLNHLAARGTLLTDYHAVTHPSLPNYVALLGGRTGRIRSDCVHCTIAGPTLLDQLEARHLSWAAYLQGLPGPARRWRARAPTPRRWIRSCTPSESAPSPPAASGSCRSGCCTPTWPRAGCPPSSSSSPIWTTTCTRAGSGSPIAGCAAWWPSWSPTRSGTRTPAWWSPSTRAPAMTCGPAATGWEPAAGSPAIVAGPRIPEGRDPTPYTHYSLLRSVEAAFGLPFLGHAGDPTTATIPAVADPSPDRE